jgi:hypothetical protein
MRKVPGLTKRLQLSILTVLLVNVASADPVFEVDPKGYIVFCPCMG